MIREEAIAYLVQADATVYKKIKTKTAEALEMAIKALEQEEAREHMDMLIAHKDKALETHPYFKRCDNCIHSEEQDCCSCYECIKNMADNFEAQPTDAVSRADVKEGMLKYGFLAPDMTVTEFVEDCLSPVTPQIEPCDDCISRQEVIEHICEDKECYKEECKGKTLKRCPDLQWVFDLPPVTPQTVTEFADKCKECGKIKEDLYEKGFEDGKRYIVDQMCALLEKEDAE